MDSEENSNPPSDVEDPTESIGALIRRSQRDSAIKRGDQAVEGWQLFNISRDLNIAIDDVKSIKFIFDKYDTNGSGLLEIDEFEQVLHTLLDIKPKEGVPKNLLESGWNE